MKQRIREAWEEYRRDVLPAGAGAVQIVETRRAFYAGALALFSAINSHLSDGLEPAPEDL